MKRRLQLLLLVIFCAYAHIVWAAEYYVDYVSGNDNNPGTKIEPWKYAPGMTSSEVSKTLQPGDTVFLKRGQSWRAERLTLKYNGSDGNRITYASRDTWGSGDLPLVGLIYHHWAAAKADYNTIDGLRIKNDSILTADYYDAIRITGIDHLQIRNCHIYECPQKEGSCSGTECGSRGVYGDYQITNILIENCTVRDNTGDGILIRGEGTSGTHIIRGCSITGNARTTNSDHQTGLVVLGDELIVEKNYVSNNGKGACGISVNPNKNGTAYVRHNWVENNYTKGISAKGVDGVNVYIYGNVVYGNDQWGILVCPRETISGGKFYIYNNTIAKNAVTGALIACGNTVEFKNNIVYDNGKYTASYRAAQITFDEWYEGQDSPVDHLTMNNNIITENAYNSDRTIQILGYPNYPSRKDFSFAEWIAYDHNGDSLPDFDQNSVFSDPAFTDYSKKDFTLSQSSPCFDVAANLGPTFGLALSPNGTSFTTSLPTVLLVEQDHDGKWDIGAFLRVSSVFSTVKNFRILPDS